MSARGPVVILDNYDSFTYNLFQLVAGLDDGREPLVFRNDALTLDELRALDPWRIIISPGPAGPDRPGYLGVGLAAITELGPTVPLLGVCLGHLGIIDAFGGRVVRAPEPCHGKTTLILHDDAGLFNRLPEPLEVMRYHSLVGERESLPECLRITAWTDERLVMGVRHRKWPIYGVQFHPESIGTEYGPRMMAHFLRDGFDNEVQVRRDV
jgi:anthranilate synthase/aminodeoxychorismate synthase-like glutamine amidotransferase